jgi:hypothetical protein
MKVRMMYHLVSSTNFLEGDVAGDSHNSGIDNTHNNRQVTHGRTEARKPAARIINHAAHGRVDVIQGFGLTGLSPR